MLTAFFFDIDVGDFKVDPEIFDYIGLPMGASWLT
jgi:hypothetical protein